MQPYQQQFLETRYGFRVYSSGDDPESAELRRAKTSVEAFVGQPIDFSADKVLWNDDFIFVPWGWIGCSGYLVHRRTQKIIGLGTVLTPDEWVWAIYHGCHVDAWEALRKPEETLVIKAIHEPSALLRALSWHRKFERRFADFDPARLKLPYVISPIDLLHAIRGLMEAEQKGYFEFEIN